MRFICDGHEYRVYAGMVVNNYGRQVAEYYLEPIAQEYFYCEPFEPMEDENDDWFCEQHINVFDEEDDSSVKRWAVQAYVAANC